MAFILDGTTGIATVDGSVSAPSQRGQDSNSGISYAADTIKFSTNGVERLAISNSGLSGDGSGLTGVSAGKILQFKYAAADSGDHSSASASGNGADVSGMSTSITLTSSSNKVLVVISCNPYIGGSGAGRYALKLFRDSTMVFEETYANFRESDGTTKATRTSYIYLDNPADTNSHTYKVALKKESGSNTVYLFNEGANAHTISLFEVDPS
tara:strand:- start:318 stop:950 length:633 start_codon:yes stop_codon:yes gene_type:complete